MSHLKLALVCVCVGCGASFGEEKPKATGLKMIDAYHRDYVQVDAVLDRCLVQWSPAGTGQDYGRPRPLPNRYSIEKWVVGLKMSPNAHSMRVSTVLEPEKTGHGHASVITFVGGLLCFDQTVYEWGPSRETPASLFKELEEMLPRWGVDKYRMEAVTTRGGEKLLMATYSPAPLEYESSRRLVGTRRMTIPCDVGCAISPCFRSWVTRNGQSPFVRRVLPYVEQGTPILPQEQYDINDPGHTWMAYDKLAGSNMDELNRTLRDTVHIARVDLSTGLVRQLCLGKTAFMGDLVGNYGVWHFTYVRDGKPPPGAFKLPFEKEETSPIWTWKRGGAP